jgi:hypothetical protein
MNSTTTTLYIHLKDGIQAQVILQILVEPTIPTPSEPVKKFPPSLHQLIAIGQKITALDVSLTSYD